LNHHIVLTWNPIGEDGDCSNSFISLIDSLQYLLTAMWPDLTYAVNQLSAYTANPSLAHQTTMECILCYLAGIKYKGIVYHAESMDLQGDNPFYRYTDIAYMNLEDYHSTSRYVFIVSARAITWGSHKQTIITLSSTEVEYVALSKATCETKWLTSLYEELDYQVQEPITLLGDNNGSIAVITNPQFYKQSKHIVIRFHWIRQQIQQNVLQIQSCQDSQQTANILTKALTSEKHN
jgi:hypothetical protein